MQMQDKELEQRIDDIINLIWTPKAVETSRVKREKKARDKILELKENSKMNKEYKL